MGLFGWKGNEAFKAGAIKLAVSPSSSVKRPEELRTGVFTGQELVSAYQRFSKENEQIFQGEIVRMVRSGADWPVEIRDAAIACKLDIFVALKGAVYLLGACKAEIVDRLLPFLRVASPGLPDEQEWRKMDWSSKSNFAKELEEGLKPLVEAELDRLPALSLLRSSNDRSVRELALIWAQLIKSLIIFVIGPDEIALAHLETSELWITIAAMESVGEGNEVHL